LIADDNGIADPFKAVGDSRRRRILDFLAARERTVGEVIEELGLAQPTVLKHLKVLREAGLVNVRRAGRWKLYRTDLNTIKGLEQWAHRFDRFSTQ